ncbi:MAG: hypothetical protein FJ272_08530, partial [Planctomycetes bacterium]|nr:hypothetical protein [Planctomycetota bacterium]
MANRLLALALGGLLALSLWPHAAFADTTAEEVEEDNSLASSLVTPHKPWAKGHAAGPVRALVFVYTGPYEGTWEDTGTRVRHVVELRQRFHLQADAVLFCGKGDKWVFHGQRLGEERAERLLATPYPLYIIAGFPMAKLPAKIQYLILKQVAEGAGLLCCGPGAADYMVAKRLLTPTPPALVQGLPMLDGKPAAQMVSAYRLRKGRGVWLKYGAQALVPTPEFTRRGLAEYDYWMLLVGRAALWAASREGDVAVSSVLGDQPFAARPGTAGEIVLTAAQPLQATVALELRRACDGAAVPLPEQKIALTPERPARVPAAIPRLRAGDYFLDVIVRSKRGVEACGAGNVTIASDFGIEKVELSRSFVERGQAIAAQVALRGEAPAGSQVRLRWRDSYDRVLKQQDWPAARNAPPPFEYVPDAFATIEMRAEAALLAGGAEVEMKD